MEALITRTDGDVRHFVNGGIFSLAPALQSI